MSHSFGNSDDAEFMDTSSKIVEKFPSSIASILEFCLKNKTQISSNQELLQMKNIFSQAQNSLKKFLKDIVSAKFLENGEKPLNLRNAQFEAIVFKDFSSVLGKPVEETGKVPFYEFKSSNSTIESVIPQKLFSSINENMKKTDNSIFQVELLLLPQNPFIYEQNLEDFKQVQSQNITKTFISLEIYQDSKLLPLSNLKSDENIILKFGSLTSDPFLISEIKNFENCSKTVSNSSNSTSLCKTPVCVFWNEKTSNWSSDGCKTFFRIDEESNNVFVNCSCNHTTTFTAYVEESVPRINYIKPNDVEELISGKTNLNLLVLVFLAVIFILYGLLFVLSYCVDGLFDLAICVPFQAIAIQVSQQIRKSFSKAHKDEKDKAEKISISTKIWDIYNYFPLPVVLDYLLKPPIARHKIFPLEHEFKRMSITKYFVEKFKENHVWLAPFFVPYRFLLFFIIFLAQLPKCI